VETRAEAVVRAHDELSLTGVVAPVSDVDSMVGELVARVAGFGPLLRQGGHALLVVLGPFHDLDEDRAQAAGVGGDLVLHPRRDLGEDRALDQAVLLEGAQLGGQHVLGDARQAALQLAEAVGALAQQPEDLELPAARDHADGPAEFGLQGLGEVAIDARAFNIDHEFYISY